MVFLLKIWNFSRKRKSTFQLGSVRTGGIRLLDVLDSALCNVAKVWTSQRLLISALLMRNEWHYCCYIGYHTRNLSHGLSLKWSLFLELVAISWPISFNKEHLKSHSLQVTSPNVKAVPLLPRQLNIQIVFSVCVRDAWRSGRRLWLVNNDTQHKIQKVSRYRRFFTFCEVTNVMIRQPLSNDIAYLDYLSCNCWYNTPALSY